MTTSKPTIKLHNTKTRKREVFTPIDPENVRMYVCGPTVYDRAHLGNARPVIVFDVLYRLLRHVYGADHVTYVRNFTDIDDKINARSAATGRPIGEITAETTQWFLDDMAAVGALEPDQMPRATAYVPQMIAMIENLEQDGFAYEKEGHVLFRVRKYKEYGSLSGRSLDDMIAGARVEVAPYKEDPMDFVLWKPSDADTPGWDSPWGRGRPGWHIECSAMAHELLGAHFDIHGGGNDLMFPHHENEIAQSCCAGDEFANVWLHNEMLQVEGKKMSKSLGNFFTVRDLLEQGVPGEVIRFVMLSTHYRKPMDWTEKKREEAENTLDMWAAKVSLDADLLNEPVNIELVDPQIIEALSDDLNTSLALTKLKTLGRFVDNSFEFLELREEDQMLKLKSFIASAEFLGIGVVNMARKIAETPLVRDLEYYQLELISLRITARETNDYSELDALKASLKNAGVEVQMSKSEVYLKPSSNFDPAKLEALK
ncbi:cysteine--tRNA ligase [Sulfitobacter sp. F26169L]|uniref:cysteine--tRNA ligase n=1 Tax=Sulfitobacter sp. F26169L TaxID=2996015 RepID=UPI002260CD44|nr:cysteine--tRNA ligase [Sulfitobacter sp. F26169L]MCX7566122.1 cysteine--tRNA ligase [Sulfitobacter sp. F26169L]